MERTFLIRRFTLLHDGSPQSWPAAYLSFHITARLGALLDVLILNSPESQAERDEQAENLLVAARAARIEVNIYPVDNFSPTALEESLLSTDSLLVPAHIASSEDIALPLIKAAGCPVWFLSRNIAIRNLALLTGSTTGDQGLFQYAAALSKRLQNSQTILISSEQLTNSQENSSWLHWHPLSSYAKEDILAALDEVDPSLVFMPVSLASIVGQAGINCVVFPDQQQDEP